MNVADSAVIGRDPTLPRDLCAGGGRDTRRGPRLAERHLPARRTPPCPGKGLPAQKRGKVLSRASEKYAGDSNVGGFFLIYLGWDCALSCWDGVVPFCSCKKVPKNTLKANQMVRLKYPLLFYTGVITHCAGGEIVTILCCHDQGIGTEVVNGTADLAVIGNCAKVNPISVGASARVAPVKTNLTPAQLPIQTKQPSFSTTSVPIH